jgi:hypothetical protein
MHITDFGVVDPMGTEPHYCERLQLFPQSLDRVVSKFRGCQLPFSVLREKTSSCVFVASKFPMTDVS